MRSRPPKENLLTQLLLRTVRQWQVRRSRKTRIRTERGPNQKAKRVPSPGQRDDRGRRESLVRGQRDDLAQSVGRVLEAAGARVRDVPEVASPARAGGPVHGGLGGAHHLDGAHALVAEVAVAVAVGRVREAAAAVAAEAGRRLVAERAVRKGAAERQHQQDQMSLLTANPGISSLKKDHQEKKIPEHLVAASTTSQRG